MGKKYPIIECASWGFHIGYGFFGVVGLLLGLFSDSLAAFCMCLAIGVCLGGLMGVVGAGIGALAGIGYGIYDSLYLLRAKRKRSSGRAEQGAASPSKPPDGLIVLFRCLGKLAKADGLVAREEADFVQSFLQEFDELDHEGRQVLVEAFDAGRKYPHSFRTMVRVLNLYERQIHKNIMQIFCTLAMADGAITGAERAMLQEAEEVLGQPGYSNRFFREHAAAGRASGSGRSSSGQQRSSRRSASGGGRSSSGQQRSSGRASGGGRSSSGQQRSSGRASGGRRTAASAPAPAELNEAYRLLDLPPAASDAEIKSAWRRKVLEFHPDKVQAKGLPEAFVALANEQSRKINQAYETICRARGIR